MEKWAVIACDQFTSDQAYWDRVRKNAEGAASTINLILPEAELGTEMEAEHTAVINKTMADYMKNDVFTTYPNSYVYVERTLENGSIREGLVGMVDLDAYDYTPGANRNRDFVAGGVCVKGNISRAMEDILFDPQTSGGLLIAVDGDDAEACLQALQSEIPCAAQIGYVTKLQENHLILE